MPTRRARRRERRSIDASSPSDRATDHQRLGHSYAAPIVAFKAAQILSRFPEASANLVRALLATSATIRERNGRVVRELFASRLTRFCREHGIDYNGNARPNSERNFPDPEPNLPKCNFEAFVRTGEMPEALAALQDHRARRRGWEAARAEEIEAALDLARLEAQIRERQQRRLCPARAAGSQLVGRRDRRAAILRAWHDGGWIDAEAVAEIASTRFDAEGSCLWINLKDGSTLIDRGDSIALRGRITWSAAVETAAAADRHGWSEVNVYGDLAYKDAVSVAALLRGVTVLNHELSPKAWAELDRLLAERAEESEADRKPQPWRESAVRYEGHFRKKSSREIHQQLTKRTFVEKAPPLAGPDAEGSGLVLKPRFRKSRLGGKYLQDSVDPGRVVD
ncbi:MULTISPECIES: LPD7 domain-containing protein [unclassified Mesorhizobium]|uniref:LPD7 domain-containing protein n=1 Tax=unclassified Mesorhizobium TaxID=325217 RepID=UPI003338EA72